MIPAADDITRQKDGPPLWYRLDKDRNPVPSTIEEIGGDDSPTWAIKNRQVARDHVGIFKVSTVSLVIDHNFGWEGPPVLFESMVFVRAPPVNQTERGLVRYWSGHQARYETWEDAEQGHREVVDALRASLKVKDPKAAIVLFDARITKAIRGLVRR